MYFSGSQAALFIGTYYLDEARNIQYNYVRNRTPIYGYSSRHYDTLLDGRVIVQGSFEINFVHPGYLLAFIAKAQGETKDFIEYMTLEGQSDIWDFENVNVAQAVASSMELTDNQISTMAEKLQSKFWVTKAFQDKTSTRADDLPPVDISLVFGYNTTKGIGKIIRQIEIIGESQAIEISGEPVVEVYSFIGRDLR